MNNYYVYAYIRSKDSKGGPKGSPYYIGKGKGQRHVSNHKRHGIHVPDISCISMVATGLNEPDAFQVEVLLIYLYGRVDKGTGCLRNRTDGGDGISGCICTDEHRAALRLAKKGCTLSYEHRHRISISQKGRQHSPEARLKLSNALKGKKKSLEACQRMSNAKKGKPIPKSTLEAARAGTIKRWVRWKELRNADVKARSERPVGSRAEEGQSQGYYQG